MSESDQDPTPERFGRTWADFTWTTGRVGVLLLLLLCAYFFGAFSSLGEILGSIPIWVLVAVGMTLVWMPWLVKISQDATRLVLVAHGGRSVSEWRLGRRVPLHIDGEALTMTSPSGAQRVLVTDFNPETLEASGTALEGATVFDLARDLDAFDRLGRAFAKHLRADRLTRETVGIEVERRVGEYSAAWLALLYGTLDPTDEIQMAMRDGSRAAFDQGTLDTLMEHLEGED